MKSGKAFELFVKHMLLNVGFSEVKSDNYQVFDGAPGLMLHGLGEAHNADVLLEPPVQTPFYSQTRLLIECKDYSTKVGLNTVRNVLGIREDINHFNIVDINTLNSRRGQHRHSALYNQEGYSYQVAIAARNGFTKPAQEFAAAYRIPLIEFNRLPFWNKFSYIFQDHSISEKSISQDVGKISQNMALALTNSGQMLFLYREQGNQTQFGNTYSLSWETPKLLWTLKTNSQSYSFQLPENLMEAWLENATNEFKMKRYAIDCKSKDLSSMVVYYMRGNLPEIKMISIDKLALEKAKVSLWSAKG